MTNSYDGRILANSLHIPLADESVHMCVTSPPYHRLRKYKIPPTVWGGDPDCEHDWLPEYSSRKHSTNGLPSSTLHGAGKGKPVRLAEEADSNGIAVDQYWGCLFCDAMKCQLGQEPTVALFVDHLVTLFDEVWRVLRSDGTCWVNLGDSYQQTGGIGLQGATSQRLGRKNVTSQQHEAVRKPTDGLKAKDISGVPWRFALAMQDRGWYWRSTIVWHKTNPMPGSQKDRPTSSWEPVFLFAKSPKYFYDHVAVMEPVTGNAHARGNGTGKKTDAGEVGLNKNNPSMQTSITEITYARNRRDVWSIPSAQLSEEHYAAYPPALVEPCILAGTSEKGVCADCGSPYLRQVEKQFYGSWSPDPAFRAQGINRNHKNDREWRKAQAEANPDSDNPFMPPKTLGWKKSCKCETTEISKAIVLDPFLGSGTTARVAEKLGRRWIGLDLGYQEMQGRRLKNIQKGLIYA